MKKYHVHPRTGEVSLCKTRMDMCEFGGMEQHWYDQSAAFDVSRKKMRILQEWTANSKCPQEPGWYTVHVFDPNTYFVGHSPIEVAKIGHRLILENGDVYEKSIPDPNMDTHTWIGVAGKKARMYRKFPDHRFHYFDFLRELELFGGRLETNDSLPQFPVDWVGKYDYDELVEARRKRQEETARQSKIAFAEFAEEKNAKKKAAEEAESL